MIRTLIQQGPDAYGLWWYRIYQIRDNMTFRIVTNSIGEPDENPLRIWRGLIYKGEKNLTEFQKALKRKEIFSSYVTWKSEVGTEFMYFHYSDLDTIIELIAQALSSEEYPPS